MELLRFIFQDPWHFFGTAFLILLIFAGLEGLRHGD